MSKEKKSEGRIYIIFFDFDEQKKKPKIIKFKINDKIYENKKKNELKIDFALPFDNCIYLNIPITCIFDNEKSKTYLFTVYYYRVNYFFGSAYGIFDNSFEFIFATTDKINFNPQIELNIDPKKIFIKSEEEFEKNSNRKRINLFNININYINNIDFNEIKDELQINESNDLLIIIGNNMKILGAHYKTKTLNYSHNFDSKFQFITNFENLINLTPNDMDNPQLKIKLKEIITKMYLFINYNNKFKKYLKTELTKMDNEDIKIYKIYIIYKIILHTIFKEKFGELIYNEENNFLLKFLLNNLILFENECKNIKEDEKIKLYFIGGCLLKEFSLLYQNNEIIYKKYIEENLQLLSLIDFSKEGNIYHEANEKNIEFVNELKESSFLFFYLLQFNSSFSRNIFVKYSIKSSSTISMITLEELKSDLLKCIPKFGIRIFYENSFIGFTEIISGITIINENKIFKRQLTDDELLSLNDKNYYKRFIICFLLKLERFAHLKHTINKSTQYLNSPNIFYNINKNKIIIFDYPEIGNAFEYFVSDFKIDFYDKIYKLDKNNDINFKELFENTKLWIANSNDEITKKFKEIDEKISYEKLEETEKNETKLKEKDILIIKNKGNIGNLIDEYKEEDDESEFDLSNKKYSKYYFPNMNRNVKIIKK